MSMLAGIRQLGSTVLLILLAAITGLGCVSSSHLGDTSGDLEVRVDQLETSQVKAAAQLGKITAEMDSLTKGQLISVLDFIERVEIHHMDEDLQDATKINPLYLGKVRKLKRVVIATPWPTPLKGKAEVLKARLTELETALLSDDLMASRKAVRKVHEGYHPLLDAGWKLLETEPPG